MAIPGEFVVNSAGRIEYLISNGIISKPSTFERGNPEKFHSAYLGVRGAWADRKGLTFT